MQSGLTLLNTREIPAFGGISLVLRGSGAFGATFRAPQAHLQRAPKAPETWDAAGAPIFFFFYRHRRRREMGTGGALKVAP